MSSKNRKKKPLIFENIVFTGNTRSVQKPSGKIAAVHTIGRTLVRYGRERGVVEIPPSSFVIIVMTANYCYCSDLRKSRLQLTGYIVLTMSLPPPFHTLRSKFRDLRPGAAKNEIPSNNGFALSLLLLFFVRITLQIPIKINSRNENRTTLNLSTCRVQHKYRVRRIHTYRSVCETRCSCFFFPKLKIVFYA